MSVSGTSRLRSRNSASAVSKVYKTLLYPEFRAGTLDRPDLLQSDQNHPNAAARSWVAR